MSVLHKGMPRMGLQSRFFAAIAERPPQLHTTRFPLAEANEALTSLREGRHQGAAVLIP